MLGSIQQRRISPRSGRVLLSRRQPQRRPRQPQVQAKYDAAQNGHENRRHWERADNLSANAAMNPEVRRILRNRSRYEVANNGYAKGMVKTLADYVIGTGPRLQMLEEDSDINRIVEQKFTRWAKTVGLAHKLRTMRIAVTESGECFCLLATNPRLKDPVKLDLRLIEADQLTSPWPRLWPDPSFVDGIQYDEYGNPVSYTVLRHHPGDVYTGWAGSTEHDVRPADSIIHLYWAERPGQSRGIPEVTSSLSLYAMLRRYTLAVVSSAEQAALSSGVIYTDAPADSEAAELEPLETVDMERGEWHIMPYGWKTQQTKAEQPTTVYSDFKHEVVNEIARPMSMPFNIASGNSSGYNYASGQLDHQSFFKSVRIDQAHIGDVVLERIFRAWLEEAVLIEGYLPQPLRMRDVEPEHDWYWDGIEHVDPVKGANAQKTRLANGTTNLAIECAKQKLDWEQVLRQRARELALARELGLSMAPADTAPDTETDREEASASALRDMIDEAVEEAVAEGVLVSSGGRG